MSNGNHIRCSRGARAELYQRQHAVGRCSIFVLTMVLILLSVLPGTPARAQFLPLSNPADTERLESSFTNPAITGFVDNRLTAGLLIHHAGFADNFADLRTTFISYHLPWEARWIEVGGQFFSPDRYNASQINVNIAHNLWDMLSLGGSVGVGSMSFNRTDFDGVEPGDPVLEGSNSKSFLTLSAGAIYWPLPNVMVGASLQNLNRPNLSMIDDPNVTQPMKLSFGVSYLGRNYRLGISYVGQEILRRGVYGDPGKFLLQAETIPNERIPLLFTASSTEMTVEGRFQVLEGLFVSYTFDYPYSDLRSSTMGSHRAALIWDFDYLPLLPALRDPVSIRSNVEPREKKGRHNQFFYAYGNNDSLFIYQRNFRREVNQDELKEVAKLLDQRELEAIYSIERGIEIPRVSEPLEVKDPLLRLEGTYTPNYMGALGDMSARLRNEAEVKSQVVAYPGSQHRAVSVLNFITGAEERIQKQTDGVLSTDSSTVTGAVLDSLVNLPTRETVIEATPESLRIMVLGVHMSDYLDPWTLVILDHEDRTVHEIQGKPELIDRQTVWDWRLADGSYIPPGEYSLYVRWVDMEGKVRHSSRRFFKVVKQVTTLTIEITREPKPARGEGDRYQLYLSE